MSTYRLDRSFVWNFEHGPMHNGGFRSIPKTPLKEFFGLPTYSKFGVAASVIVNERWLETYSRLGFDLLTYKSVRLIERRCHAFPNWVFVDGDVFENSTSTNGVLVKRHRRNLNLLQATGAGSFGMPSKSPSFWLNDIRNSRSKILDGQVLIVSVVATPRSNMSKHEIAEEYGILAQMVIEAGAQVVEANLSCPNVTTGEGELYADSEMVCEISNNLRKNSGRTPITLKLGHISDDELLTSVLRAANDSVDGVVLMNGINKRVIDKNGNPAFSSGRETCGITGAGIHKIALNYVRRAIDIVARENLSLKIIANGGVVSPESAKSFFDTGAYAVTSASGAVFDPQLALSIKTCHPEW
ncbi:MAG: hypothetical protein VYB39_02355 [Pseudomonadota bacterium]|nr:hypothetical protein [Pseudomonadota bacterium]